MENMKNERLERYQKTNPKSAKYLMRGMDILHILINNHAEGYLIGSCVRDYYLGLDISEVTILSNFTVNEIKNIFPALKVKEDKGLLFDQLGIFYFQTYSNDTEEGSVKDEHFNKKLVNTLKDNYYTMSAGALSPNFSLTNIFECLDDLDNHLIKSIDKTKNTFREYPEAILEGLVLYSKYKNFKFEKKTLKGMVKFANYLSDLNDKVILKYIKNILEAPYFEKAIKLILDYELFKSIGKYERFLNSIERYGDKMDKASKCALLYLFMGKIIDADAIENRELNEITELMTFTQLLISDKVTPMMVYNIGVEKLLCADLIAKAYRRRYKSQVKKIIYLKHKMVIKSPRELNYTKLELIKALGDSTSIKVKIIMNLLLEKVLNKEVPNLNSILKEVALDIAKDIDDIYNYNDEDTKESYTDEEILALNEKYNKVFNFLVKVYLNDEKDLYSLSPLEREEVIDNAKSHAKEFLLETSQYKILLDKGIIL